MRRNSNFKFAYIVYVAILVIICAGALIYVRLLLAEYENSQPERKIEEQIEQIKEMSREGTIEDYIEFSKVTAGKFEKDRDIRADYYKMLAEDELTYDVRAGDFSDADLTYDIKSGDITLVSVKLSSDGESRTKLAVFNMTDFTVSSVTPVMEAKNYEVEIPSDFTVSLNGIPLENAEKVSDDDSLLLYRAEGLYLKPDFEIKSNEGERAEYNILKGKVTPVLFDYTLTLPSSINVKLNGEHHEGEALEGHMTKHIIRMLQEPEVILSDAFGGSITYKGGSELPLTFCYITAPSGYRVKADGADVPESIVTKEENPDYEHIKDYCTLPEAYGYNVALLKNDVSIEVLNENGQTVEFDKSQKAVDLTIMEGAAEIPEEILSETDVLEAAKTWSLFMSKDLSGSNYGFYQVAEYLIEGSYLYDEAYKWATGIDITFTSTHTLANPPFINESVKNYVRLSEDCFTCDISFEKQMILTEGNLVPDKMNSRFYFVKYDDSNDGIYNPVWKIANIKEIVNG